RQLAGKFRESHGRLPGASPSHHAGSIFLHKPVCRDRDDAVKFPQVAEDFLHVFLDYCRFIPFCDSAASWARESASSLPWFPLCPLTYAKVSCEKSFSRFLISITSSRFALAFQFWEKIPTTSWESVRTLTG